MLQIITDDEVDSEVLNPHPEVNEEANTCTDSQSFVSPAQACEALETVLEWLVPQGDVKIEHSLLVLTQVFHTLLSHIF